MQDHSSEYSSEDLTKEPTDISPHHRTGFSSGFSSHNQLITPTNSGFSGADVTMSGKSGHTEAYNPLQRWDVYSMLEDFIKGKLVYRLNLPTTASPDEMTAFIGYKKKLFEADWNFIDLSSLELIVLGKKESELPMPPKLRNLDVKKLQEADLGEDILDSEELGNILSEFDASDIRIREHQAVTAELGKDTRRGLSELKKVVSEL